MDNDKGLSWPPGTLTGPEQSPQKNQQSTVCRESISHAAEPYFAQTDVIPALPRLLELDEARSALAGAMGAFTEHAIAWLQDEDVSPEIHVIRSTTGVGKTKALSQRTSEIRAVIKRTAEIRAALGKNAVIGISEPTLEKCDEVGEQLIRDGVAERHEVLVMRGREAPDPKAEIDVLTGKPFAMCRRDKSALNAIAGYLPDVKRHMCLRTWTDENGEKQEIACPFAAKCSHLAQANKARFAKIIIVPHATLAVGSSEFSDEAGRLAALIIDENAFGTLISHPSGLPLENVFAVPTDPNQPWHCREPNLEAKFPGMPEAADPRPLLKAQYRKILAAVETVIKDTRSDTRRAEIRPSLLAQAIAAACGAEIEGRKALADFTHKQLSFMAVFERNKADLAGITPTTPDAEILELVKSNRIHDRFKLAGLWTRLREQVDRWGRSADETAERRDYCRSILVDWKATAETQDGGIVSAPAFRMHYSREFKAGFGKVPTLILDADADPLTLSRWVDPEQLRFNEITAKFNNVIVRQAVDRTGSMTSIKKPATQQEIVDTANYLATKYRSHIAAGFKDRFDDYCGHAVKVSPRAVAIFTLKDAEKGIDEAFTVPAGASEAESRLAVLNGLVDPDYVTVGHFGALRGLNLWESCAAAIIAGRQEVTVDKLEDQARAVWHDSDVDLDYIEQKPNQARRLQPVKSWYRTKRRGLVPTERTGHPDARIDAILVGIREAEVRQAIGRVRPVQRPEKGLPVCEVFVLTSIPLGLDIEIDDTHDWADLVADELDKVYAHGVIPDHGGDLATLAELSPENLRVKAHRRRAKRDIQAPRPGTPTDRATSAYADCLGRPGALDIGSRKILRVSYTVETASGDLVSRGATVLVSAGETRRNAWLRAVDSLERIGATIIFEGAMDDDSDDFAMQLDDELYEAEQVGAWWNALQWTPPVAGRYGNASPPTRH